MAQYDEETAATANSGQINMERLIYASESKIADEDVHAVIPQMVAEARERYLLLYVTGALIFTGTHFAHVLEGCEKAIDEVMSLIYNDERHGAVWIVDRTAITERQFPNWAMAYQGPSHFVSSHVTLLYHATFETEKQRATKWLIELALEFAKS